MKNVLIVDDEIEITKSLGEYLTDKGFNVLACNSVDQAFDFYKNQKADLIISDIKMPGKSGLDLFRLCTTEPASTKIPFVLMTGFSDIIGAENAFSMGVSELIAKPFDLDTINLVLNYLLNLDGAVGAQQYDFYPVQINEFINSRSTEYDIYLKIGEKFLLVTRSGQEFSEQRIRNFSKKGVAHIFLKSNDFAKYIGLEFAITSTINIRPIEIVRKQKVMSHLISSVRQNLLTLQFDEVHIANSLLAFEAYANISLTNSLLNTTMNHLMLSAPQIIEKSALRAILCSMVTGHWKWNSSKVQSRLIMAAFLCDISLKDHPELLNKKISEYSPAERNFYESHPIESHRILIQIPNIPVEITTVALQHHENSAGLGFPQKIARNKLHSYSIIIQCVNEFIENIYLQPSLTDIQHALDQLLENQGKMLNQQVIKTLYQIFHLKMPKTLEIVLLPNQTSRLN